MSKILVITSLPDPHVEVVEKFLPHGVSFEIFDPKALALSGNMTISQEGLLNKLGREIPLSVWYRKPKFIKIKDLQRMNIAENYYASILSLHEEGYSLVFATYPDCFWVSNPYAIKKASNKLTQLIVARKIGFNIPRTIFSSTPKDIEDFRLEIGDVVMKPLGLPYARVNGVDSWLYATLILSGRKLDYDGIGITPMIFQERIKKRFDLRVTVIGEQVFGCKIVSQNLDWRSSQSKSSTLYTEFVLENNFAKKCVEMTKYLDLNFGAFDFVYSMEGEIFFLEINPNGQWAFVEEKTGLPLSKTMAELLVNSP
ncbi:MAG: hypothetical protein ACOX6Q_00435 [Candidatus Dojkabacteria bacterium]|jgi:glutathione synthase/RimK-type ligase-like ATP-grasp enzyme